MWKRKECGGINFSSRQKEVKEMQELVFDRYGELDDSWETEPEVYDYELWCVQCGNETDSEIDNIAYWVD